MILKHKIVDTNVLLTDDNSLMGFMPKRSGEKVIVYVPLPVLRELDNFKSEDTERGRAARSIISQMVYNLRDQYFGDMHSGIQISPSYEIKSLYIPNSSRELDGIVSDDLDGLILKMTNQLQKDNPGEDVELITNDGALLLQAESLGIKSNYWKKGESLKHDTEMYNGWVSLTVPSELIDTLCASHSSGISLDQFIESSRLNIQIYPNEYFSLTSNSSNSSVLAKYSESSGKIVKLAHPVSSAIPPKGAEQLFVADALYDKDIDAVFIFGPAGTGKTLLSVNAGYELTIDGTIAKRLKQKQKRRLLITRPIVHEGNEIGFLPGSEREKLAPWLMPIFDNLAFVYKSHGVPGDESNLLEEKNYISVQNLDSIRGRTLPGIYFIIDEAQNTTRSQAKTLITRMGDGSKIVFTGDPDQISQKGLTRFNNGMIYLSESMKSSSCTATIVLTEHSCRRSRLVKDALRILS